MKIRKSILSAGTGVLLAACGGLAIASPQHSTPAVKQALPSSNTKSASNVSRGTITSIDDSRLVMTHKTRNGKTENLTFMLNPQTERRGVLKPGSKISVHYTKEKSQLMATAIRVTPATRN
jgi:hypothetical protein